jgi:predicted ABC-type ATPase
VTVVGGRGGSGKGWLTRPGGPIDASKSMVLDTDAIKAMLPEYQGWNAAQLHEESSDIADRIDRAAAEHGLNVTLDGTMKSASIEKRIGIYKKANPDLQLHGHYMYASPETAATRAMGRYAKGGTFSGRFVPPEVILGNTENEKNFDRLSKGMKKWSVYDNSGKAPRLVERHGY